AAAAAPEPVAEVNGDKPDGRLHRRNDPKARGANQPNAAAQPAEEKIEYRLLRVFDYSVEPKKKYRYRVRLWLNNPNFGIEPQFLKDTESAKTEGLAGEFSEPTGPVTIPDGQGVLAGSVDPGTSREPKAKLVLTAIDPEKGIEVAAELANVSRGVLTNAQ